MNSNKSLKVLNIVAVILSAITNVLCGFATVADLISAVQGYHSHWGILLLMTLWLYAIIPFVFSLVVGIVSLAKRYLNKLSVANIILIATVLAQGIYIFIRLNLGVQGCA